MPGLPMGGVLGPSTSAGIIRLTKFWKNCMGRALAPASMLSRSTAKTSY